jgi:hypothetical protein
MTAPQGAPLPEIDDSELAARLAPLVHAVVPSERVGRKIPPESRNAGTPGEGARPADETEARNSGIPGFQDSANPELWNSDRPDSRSDGIPERREAGTGGDGLSGAPDSWNSGTPAGRPSGSPGPRPTGQPENGLHGSASAQRAIKRGVEFLLPDRVVLALKADAAQRGVSASIRLLEILRDAGYPVFQEDFIDLRKLPRR